MVTRFIAFAMLVAFTGFASAQPSVSFSASPNEKASHKVVIFQDDIVPDEHKALFTAFETAKALNNGSTSHHYATFGAKHIIALHTDTPLDNPVALQNLGGQIAAALPTDITETYSVDLSGLKSNIQHAAAFIAEGAMLRGYQFQTYKTTKKADFSIEFTTPSAKDDATYFESQRLPVVEGVYMARNFASEPGNTIYPASFIDRAKAALRGLDDVKIRVLDRKDLEKNNMGALLGVGKGSIHDPAMLIVEYSGGKKGEAPIVLAGKGITFDTGGTSLKPNNNMWQMKSDLSGAAAVAGTLHAIAKQGLAINVVGVMPLAENMPAEDAIRPGDVLTTMQGTTIEIISTDAEGRLILADAVRYAQDKYKPSMLLNIATLTGSAARALSDEYAALITRDWDLSVAMKAVGEQSGEHVWPLPLHPNHFKQLKSDIADIKNSGVGNPGASIGAAVIGTFIDEDLPWVHLDIAGVDYLTEATDVAPKGFHGWGVRFMTQLIANEAKKGN
ncbi:leucyl aminopeptidase [Alteromonas sediminis]|uniref:Leucyl aminopeptidase n=1 Tax=Alteromonas sediminis TaxID=2259342 RepID=A0A3N5Y259_9ALTE|nr:leucyl aminopeptidase [Alteromonas sediminis]RPJ66746.1 leucyl aminopeptidase [Alteromonas sediminis]